MSYHGSVDFALPLRQDVALSAGALASMMERERTAYASRDYLSVGDGDGDDDDSTATTTLPDLARRFNRVTPEDRERIVDWCYDVVDHCRFDRETVAIAANALDRYLGGAANADDDGNPASPSHAPPDPVDALHDRARYQLVAVTALYVAVKLNERATFGSGDFAAVSHGTYAAEEIEAMERRLLRGLGWRLCPPTSLQVGYRILMLLMSRMGGKELARFPWDFLRDEMVFQTEIAVRDYYFTTQRPSTVAMAAVTNAIQRADERHRPCLMAALHGVLKEFAFDGPLALLEARARLRRLVGDNGTVGHVVVSAMPPTPDPTSAISDDDDDGWDDDSCDSCDTVH